MARVRGVYGFWRMTHDKKGRALRVEYDGSRLSEYLVAGLLRSAGIDLLEKLGPRLSDTFIGAVESL
jgi:hypothetical protein